METNKLDSFLEKVLMIELRLPSSDIRSYAWFHGQINRKEAELLLTNSGHYLVRQSNSQKGQYVLSCFFQQEHLHFMILKHESSMQLLESKQHFQYSFDGDLFGSVKELIDHHLVNRKHITKTSNAIITESINRRLPLNHIQLTKYFENNSDKSIDELLKDIDIHTILPSSVANNPNGVLLTDYLKQIQHETSAINLENNANEIDAKYLNENRYFYVNKIIAETNPEILASHIFKRNATFVGLDLDLKRESNFSEIKSGIEFMLLPVGKQMRRDIIIRHECLKYFVVITIVTAIDSDTRLHILQKWIQVASELNTMFGDYFGFGSVMSGLCHDKVVKLSLMWLELENNYANKWTLFESNLKPKFIGLLKANQPLWPNTSIPFVIQLCHLIESHSIQNSKLLNAQQCHLDIMHFIENEVQSPDSSGLANFSIDDIFEHIMMSTQILDNLNLFEDNSKIAFEGFFFEENILEQIFKTQFHLKFLFDEEINVTDLTQANFRHLEQKFTMVN